MITNTNVIIHLVVYECVVQTGSGWYLEHFCIAWLAVRTVLRKYKETLFQNSSRNSSQEQLIGKHHMETSEQPKDQFCRVFAAASCSFTRCPVGSTRVLV